MIIHFTIIHKDEENQGEHKRCFYKKLNIGKAFLYKSDESLNILFFFLFFTSGFQKVCDGVSDVFVFTKGFIPLTSLFLQYLKGIKTSNVWTDILETIIQA